MVKSKKKIDINKMFDTEQTDFLPSLNEEIKGGLEATNMEVLKFENVSTEYGVALRIELKDLDTDQSYSFLSSGKVFTKLFEEHVEVGDKITIFLNEKQHWRFDFVK